MSEDLRVLSLQEDDVLKMLLASTHLGSTNLNFHMESYVYKRRSDGVHVINLRHTWEKLLLAARAVAAFDNPAEVFVISSCAVAQRAVIKFASYTGCTPIAGRFTPGAFTNQIQAEFREPRLLIVSDPVTDHQPITESAYVNIPVIAFCNTDSPLKYVDVAIPCNNKSPHGIGLMWWMLAREVLRMRGTISRETKWDVMVDLFFYRNLDMMEKEEQTQAEATVNKQPIIALTSEQPWDDYGDDTPVVSSMVVALATPAVASEDWTSSQTQDFGTASRGEFNWADSAEDWD